MDKEELRTPKQNDSLHLWFELLAERCIENGIGMGVILEKLSKYHNITPTKNSIKYSIWHPIQMALYQKKSTKDLNKKEEIDRIYDEINKFFSEQFNGLDIPPFPSEKETDSYKKSLENIKH